eukprot:1065119_1
MNSETNCNTHVADDTTVIFKSVEQNNSSDDVRHEESEQKSSEDISITNTPNESNNSTDNGEHQITTNDNDDEEEIKSDQPIVSSSVTKPNHSHRSNAQIYTDTDETRAFNYWFVLFISLIFLSIGYIIYVFTGIGWIVLFFSAVGFITSATYEYIQHDKQSEKHDSGGVFGDMCDEDEHKFGIDVSTKFTKVTVTGATRVYHETQNGVLVLEKRALYIFDDYQGYEIVGGISSFVGFAITIAAALSKTDIKSLTDDTGDLWIAICTLLFITTVCACFGCIIEIELRKCSDFLPPNKTLFTTSTSIPLHEIISVDKYSIRYPQHHRSDLEPNMKRKFGLFVLRLMIAWFNALLGVFKLFVYLYKALYVNAAVVLFVMIFFLVFLLFE